MSEGCEWLSIAVAREGLSAVPVTFTISTENITAGGKQICTNILAGMYFHPANSALLIRPSIS